MNKFILHFSTIVIVTITMSSCRSQKPTYYPSIRDSKPEIGVIDSYKGVQPNTEINSKNEYDLIVDGETIVFSIDYSTPEGRSILNSITSLEQAQNIVTNMALKKYKCSELVASKFDYYKENGQLLRVTIIGQPAHYKNAPRNSNSHPGNNNSVEGVITIP